MADSRFVGRLAPSPNHGERQGNPTPDCLILHYTGMADGPSALAWLCNPASQVSSHYLIEEDGTIVQLVPEARRAWHAGRASWHGATDINSLSIGIEIVNAGHDRGLPPYPDAQISALIALSADIAGRHALRPERILGHSDIAPGRKRDPGERFPWDRLAAEGLGLWVAEIAAEGRALRSGDRGPQVAALQGELASYGYGLDRSGIYDAATEIVVRAFQRHFRPSAVDGIADAGTRATLRALIEALAARSSSHGSPASGAMA